jgi:hypothetical protein
VPKVEISKVTKRPKAPTKRQWLYTRRQAAELLGISIDSIKLLERRGRLKAVKLNGERSLALLKRADLILLAGLTDREVSNV